jgi:Holliday junction DNA helicase RuvA
VLAVHRPDDIRRAVATEDLNALVKVPGIGKKGAQRIVLDLKDRLGPPLGTGTGAVPAPRQVEWQEQLRAALMNLGYGLREVDDAVAAVEPTVTDTPSVATLLRQALSVLRPT